MQRHSLEILAEALDRRGVRYLVAGGLAVVAHGYLRATLDVDIVLDLDDPQNVQAAIDAFRELDYRCVLPVALEEFANPAKRSEWVRTKGAMVFRLLSPAHHLTPVDLFLQPPFAFAAAYADDRRAWRTSPSASGSKGGSATKPRNRTGLSTASLARFRQVGRAPGSDRRPRTRTSGVALIPCSHPALHIGGHESDPAPTSTGTTGHGTSTSPEPAGAPTATSPTPPTAAAGSPWSPLSATATSCSADISRPTPASPAGRARTNVTPPASLA